MSTDWLARLGKLRVDTDSVKGRAPHKPLLLLAVIDLFESGAIDEGIVGLTPDLLLRFQNLWPIVLERRRNRGDIHLPFHALATDKVWSVFDSDHRPSRSRETSVTAQLDPALAALLKDPVFRSAARLRLVTAYFPLVEQVALAAALGISEAGLLSGQSTEAAGSFREAREKGRSARFKNIVVSGYRFTCALTGYRLITLANGGIVEAAHIHAFRDSRNDDPSNGLALTPTAHALFDRGLWSVDDGFRIIVGSRMEFTEEAPLGGFSLRALAGQPLHIPSGVTLRPSPEHLAWHRRFHRFT